MRPEIGSENHARIQEAIGRGYEEIDRPDLIGRMEQAALKAAYRGERQREANIRRFLARMRP